MLKLLATGWATVRVSTVLVYGPQECRGLTSREPTRIAKRLENLIYCEKLRKSSLVSLMGAFFSVWENVSGVPRRGFGRLPMCPPALQQGTSLLSWPTRVWWSYISSDSKHSRLKIVNFPRAERKRRHILHRGRMFRRRCQVFLREIFPRNRLCATWTCWSLMAM